MSPIGYRRVLVTGAAGFIGSHLTNALLEVADCEVVGIDDLRAGDWSRVSGSVEKVTADITGLSRDDWSGLADGCSHIFHLAAEKYNSPNTSDETLLATNVSAMQRLIDGVCDLEDSRMVFTSSLYAYGSTGPEPMSEDDPLRPSTVYGASKAAGEHLLAAARSRLGLDYNIARLFFIYGPGQFAEGGYKSVIVSNFERIKAGEPPLIIGSGTQALDYVYIDDCVHALMLLGVSDRSGATVNVSTGHGESINDLTAAMVSVASADQIEPAHGPPDWTDGTTRVGQPDLALSQFGWKAETPLDKGLSSTWHAMNSH